MLQEPFMLWVIRCVDVEKILLLRWCPGVSSEATSFRTLSRCVVPGPGVVHSSRISRLHCCRCGWRSLCRYLSCCLYTWLWSIWNLPMHRQPSTPASRCRATLQVPPGVSTTGRHCEAAVPRPTNRPWIEGWLCIRPWISDARKCCWIVFENEKNASKGLEFG